jgi:hypothetical protein
MVVLVALGIVILAFGADALPELLFGLFGAYALSGYFMWVVTRIRGRRPPPASTPAP